MKLTISNSPHLHTREHTAFLMYQVILALAPVVLASVYFFGWRAVFLILNCTLTSLITESLILKIRKKSLAAIKDFSAVLTGLLLALVLPPATQWYAATLGAVVAIFIGKHLFGGLGSNIFNPALIGRAFLMAAYPRMLATYIAPHSVDAVTKATPLALRKFSQTLTPLGDLFLGEISGSLGETSAVCIIIGGLYLLIRKIADWRTPLSLLATVGIVASIFYFQNPANGSIGFHLCSGGLLLGAFFMATDPVTTPLAKTGRLIFGIGCGLIIMTLPYFGGLPEGVMYSILFMNAFTPLINRYLKPRRYGECKQL